LQAQVEPHFLFNTLASVRSLIQSEPHRAAEMVDALAVYLRSTLPRLRESTSAPVSTLRAQFEICKTFLALMDLRLGGRLTVSTDLPEALAGLPFPSSLLISWGENAVRHGVEPKIGPSRIELAARQCERMGVPTLEVVVQDDGAGLQDGPVEGTGLANVRGQMHLLYGAAARLSIESRASGGARAAISVPIGALTP
jgi:LytS/YehU family sensor histidine kinase